MRKLTVVFLLLALALSVHAAGAPAYDRTPLRLSALVPDGWGQTTTGAQAGLRARYDDVVSVWCGGVIMNGYAADSSWISGTVRVWDKLYCGVKTSDGTQLVMVFDQKGRRTNTYRVYRVKVISG